MCTQNTCSNMFWAKRNSVISRPLPQVPINAIEITKNYAQFPSTVSNVAWAVDRLLVAWSIQPTNNTIDHTHVQYTRWKCMCAVYACMCVTVGSHQLHNNGQCFGVLRVFWSFRKKRTIWIRLVWLKIKIQQQMRCDWPFYATNGTYDW